LTNKDISFKKLRSDRKDLLFITEKGDIIPYWIENKNNSKISVWLKFREIASSLRVVWLYYGSNTFLGVRPGSIIFEFFDDYNDLDISDYTVVSGTWAADEEAGNGILRATQEGANLIIHNTANFSAGIVIRSKVRGETSGTSLGHVFGYQDSSNFYHTRISMSGEIQIYEWKAGDPSEKGSTSVDVSQDVWYILETIWSETNKIEVNLHDENGNLLASASATMTADFANGKIGFRSYNKGSCDELFIRKYSETEPIVDTKY